MRRRLLVSVPSRCAMLALGVGTVALFSSGAAAAPAALLVNTERASNVTSSSAVLHGAIRARGATASFVFQYGTTRAYGAQTPAGAAGGATRAVGVSQTVGGLRPNTLYHYRLVATAGSTVAGRDRTFVTARVPLSFSFAGYPNPVPFGSPFIIAGRLSGTGAAGRRITLKLKPFPFLGRFEPFGSSVLTSASGSFSFFVAEVPVNTQVQLSTTARRAAVVSAIALEGVAARVSLHVRHTRRRGFVRFYGTVAPAEVGARVGFQLLVRHRKSVNVGGTVVKAGTPTVSKFSRVVHVPRHGFYRALVRINDPAHVSGSSGAVLVR